MHGKAASSLLSMLFGMQRTSLFSHDDTDRLIFKILPLSYQQYKICNKLIVKGRPIAPS